MRSYSCNEDDRFCRTDREGRSEELLLDKENDDPYLQDEKWRIYQDDADGDSLHLLHLSSGRAPHGTAKHPLRTHVRDGCFFCASRGARWGRLRKSL